MQKVSATLLDWIPDRVLGSVPAVVLQHVQCEIKVLNVQNILLQVSPRNGAM